MTAVDRIRAARLVPVLRLPDAAAALSAVDTCVAAGLDVVELTTTTRDWEQAVRRAVTDHPGLCVGTGTVTTVRQAKLALDNGARFLVSPCPVPAVRAALDAGRDRGGVELIEGGFSVAEVWAASARGVAKLFPAHVGGPAYLRSLLSVLPDARVVPTGGVRLADVPEWLAAGAYAVGVGTDLLRQADPGATVRAVLAGL